MATNDDAPDRIQRGVESSRDSLLDYLLQRHDNDINLPRFCLRLLSSLLFPPNPAATSTTTTVITIPVTYNFISSTTTRTVRFPFLASFYKLI